MLRRWLFIFSLLLSLPGAAYAQKGHVKDLISEYPMPELFLQPVKYVAHTGTTTVFMRTEEQYCFDEQGKSLSPCWIVPYSAEPSDNWVDYELFTVTVPRKSLRDVIAFAPRFGPSFMLQNYSGADKEGFFQARLTVTMESPAFPDGPVASTFGDRMVTVSLPVMKRFGDTITYTRHGIINRQWLRENANLSEAQVNAFFDNDIKLTVKVRVRAALMIYGSIYAGLLIEGY